MTDEEILMELHPAFSEETAWMQNNKFPRTYDKEILAYRNYTRNKVKF